MYSLTASPSHFLFSSLDLNARARVSPSVFFVVSDSIRWRMRGKVAALNVFAVRDAGSLLSCSDFFKNGNSYVGFSVFLRNCKDCDSDGGLPLGKEILEFMKSSKNPEEFPSMKDSMDAGSMDWAAAIIKKGGWLSFGWDLNEENDEGFRELGFKDEDSLTGNESDVKNGSYKNHGYESQGSGATSASAHHSQPATPSGRTVEMDNEDSGVESLLDQLKNQKNNFGFTEKDNTISFEKNDGVLHNGSTTDLIVDDTGRSNKPALSATTDDCPCKIGQNTSLLDAEITPINTGEGAKDMLGDNMLEVRGLVVEPIDREKLRDDLEKVNHNEIRSRVQQLESELSSVLNVLRSIHLDQKSSPDNWEFEENKIMNVQDRLRSIRAKLAILERRITLTVIDGQKIVKEKQKRIYGARRALELLRPTCMVWLNSATEVLVQGSFDGWSTQWKMEKSSSGIFHLWLRLYPGKYQIKFIIDGKWSLDPLRPIVHSDGYENNLLIVHDREQQD